MGLNPQPLNQEFFALITRPRLLAYYNLVYFSSYLLFRSVKIGQISEIGKIGEIECE
jgi:hypothetical protein